MSDEGKNWEVVRVADTASIAGRILAGMIAADFSSHNCNAYANGNRLDDLVAHSVKAANLLAARINAKDQN